MHLHMSVCVCVRKHLSMGTCRSLWSPERASNPPRALTTGHGKSPNMMGNASPLYEQYLLLTSDPSLQLLRLSF